MGFISPPFFEIYLNLYINLYIYIIRFTLCVNNYFEILNWSNYARRIASHEFGRCT